MLARGISGLSRRGVIAHPRYRAFHQTPTQWKAISFLLADIGEGITEVEVIQWFVKQGDKVEQFQKICEVQSDKAAVEITSRFDGTVKSLKYSVGDVAKVGSPLMEIDVDEEDGVRSEGTPASSTEKPASEPTPVTPATVNSTPITTTSTAPSSSPSNTQGHADTNSTLATPAVRRVAKEFNVNLGLVTGSGPQGRVLKGDVLDFIAAKGQTPTGNTSPAVKSSPASPAPGTPVSLTAVQKAMFKAMTKSLAIPHFGYSDEIVLDKATEFRQAVNAYLASNPTHGIKKMSYMPIFLKALSLALNKYPLLNAALQSDENANTAQLVYRAEHHIGVAMDTPQGLLVPSVKNVQSKSILEISQELDRLKDLGSKNALSPADLAPGTITLSNIGSIGGTLMHPVLVQGQVCIGAIGKVQTLPRYIPGSTIPVPTQVLSVSFNADHRVVDGATMARFVQEWKRYIETPLMMNLHLR